MPKKTPRIDHDSFTMSKNALGIWNESRTIFRIREFVEFKLFSRIPDRSMNCKNSLRTVLISCDLHELSTIQPRIQIFVNSWDSGPVWNRGIRRDSSVNQLKLYRCEIIAIDSIGLETPKMF